MNATLRQLAAVLDHVQQPVLLLEAGVLVYQNDAAERMLPGVTAEWAQTLSDGTVQYQGTVWNAALHSVEAAVTVITLWPTDDTKLLSTNILEIVAQTMREPLSTQLSISQLLFSQLDVQQYPQLQQSVSALNKSFYQLMRLANNLSDVSMLAMGASVLQRQPLELSHWLAQIAEQLEPYCRMRGVLLHCHCPDTPCWALADASYLERALLNLISNALKYATSGGHIAIVLEAGRTQLRIKIIDNGEGIDPALTESLFTRFTARPTLGDPRWGVGLGLQLVRQIALLHGGTVMAEPHAEGGVCVTVSLERLRDFNDHNDLRSPTFRFDYAGSFNHVLLELSDALPAAAFAPRDTE